MSQPRHEYLAHHLRPPGAQIAAAASVRHGWRRARGERREVRCGPGRLVLPEAMWKVLRVLGLRAVSRPGPRVVVNLHWTLATRAATSPGEDWVNGRCLDIGKRRVDAALRRAAGYGTRVDPLLHAGPMVAKGEENAAHDGTVVRGPLERPDPSLVYQRLVDTDTGRGTLEELRTPVVAGTIPFVYVKRRPVADRFGHGPSRALIAGPDAVLSRAEQATVLRVCADLGLDVGEVDVLRDRGDGRIHVVDANRTPWGPPRTLGARGCLRAIDLLAEAFAAAYGV